jgi:hypothetical protein
VVRIISAKAREMWRALFDSRCTTACQVDRELLTLRTDLTVRSGWSAAGIQ